MKVSIYIGFLFIVFHTICCGQSKVPEYPTKRAFYNKVYLNDLDGKNLNGPIKQITHHFYFNENGAKSIQTLRTKENQKCYMTEKYNQFGDVEYLDVDDRWGNYDWGEYFFEYKYDSLGRKIKKTFYKKGGETVTSTQYIYQPKSVKTINSYYNNYDTTKTYILNSQLFQFDGEKRIYRKYYYLNKGENATTFEYDYSQDRLIKTSLDIHYVRTYNEIFIEKEFKISYETILHKDSSSTYTIFDRVKKITECNKFLNGQEVHRRYYLYDWSIRPSNFYNEKDLADDTPEIYDYYFESDEYGNFIKCTIYNKNKLVGLIEYDYTYEE